MRGVGQTLIERNDGLLGEGANNYCFTAMGAGGGARPPPIPPGARPGDAEGEMSGAPMAGVGMCADITGGAIGDDCG